MFWYHVRLTSGNAVLRRTLWMRSGQNRSVHLCGRKKRCRYRYSGSHALNSNQATSNGMCRRCLASDLNLPLTQGYMQRSNYRMVSHTHSNLLSGVQYRSCWYQHLADSPSCPSLYFQKPSTTNAPNVLFCFLSFLIAFDCVANAYLAGFLWNTCSASTQQNATWILVEYHKHQYGRGLFCYLSVTPK